MNDKINKKLVHFFHLSLLSYLFLTIGLQYDLNGNSIDGTTSPQYLTTNQVLRDGQYARGFVKLNSGATILGDATVSFDITEPISGGLDLRDAGVISLGSNLYLDSNFTITSNGVIRGNGHTIFMSGDLMLSDAAYVRVLHINTDTIIDGCGHSLILGKRARFFVDDNVTLTLKNMIIKPTFNYVSDSCIKLASNRSKLALDNVKIDLVQDFDFVSGQLFVHNDVAITGTSAFVYHSTQPSFIASGATLYFDLGTTFSVAPATFTDCKFDQWPTRTSNNFIKMADETSQLYFNGSSLLSTFTGCRFTKGTVNFENSIKLKSNAISTVSSLAQISLIAQVGTGSPSDPQAVSWSPDGRFIAVALQAVAQMQVFTFDGINNIIPVGLAVSTGGNSFSINWSPDGRFIGVVSESPRQLRVFSFSGSGTPVLVGSAVTLTGSSYSAKWSPDGRFIAVADYDNSNLRIFFFNGASTPTQVGSRNTGSGPFTLSWSPDGRFIVVSHYGANTLQVYYFGGAGNPVPVGGALTVGAGVRTVSWSPDGRFIAIVSRIAYSLNIFSFNGSSTPIEVGRASVSGALVALSWSPDGKFIAVIFGDGKIQIFLFDGAGNPIAVKSSGDNLGNLASALSWTADGKYIAITDSIDNMLRIVRVNYIVDSSDQAMSNGIVFGDSAKGAAYDPTVNILGNAYVENYGLVNYDCVN